MKKKMRKFADGGYATAEGENKNISDDIRARALRSVMPDDSPAGTTGYGEQNDLPETKTVTKTTVSKTPAKTVAPTMPAEEKARMETLVKKQALTPVRPEEMLIGGGGLKVLQAAGKKLASKLAAGRTKTYTQAEIDAMTPKLPRPSVKQLENNPTKRIALDKSTYKSPVEKAREARASARTSQMKQENYDAGPAGRARASGAMVDDFTPGSTDLLSRELRPDFKRGGKVKAKMSYKSGGSVKSSASRRADGCAIRGKTRA
jgi:hypothetical protein